MQFVFVYHSLKCQFSRAFALPVKVLLELVSGTPRPVRRFVFLGDDRVHAVAGIPSPQLVLPIPLIRQQRRGRHVPQQTPQDQGLSPQTARLPQGRPVPLTLAEERGAQEDHDGEC